MKHGIMAAAAALWLVLPGSADAKAGGIENELGAYIRDMSVSILAASRAQSEAEREAIQAHLRCVLRDGVDFGSMSRTVLGAAGRHASEKNRAEFTELFAAFAINEALTKLSQFQVTGISIHGGKTYPNGDVVVPTQVHRKNGEGVELSFRVRLVQERPRVVDLLVDGYSAVIHYHGVFERRARGNVSQMLDILRKEVSGIPSCRRPVQTAAN